MIGYLEFILERAEMPLYYSDELRQVLTDIKNLHPDASKVASALLFAEDQGREMAFSLVDLGADDDKVSFVQANRYLAQNPDGEMPKKTDPLWSGKKRTEYYVGKFAGAVARKGGWEVPGATIEMFVSAYKAVRGRGTAHFRLAEGEDIRYWYREDNYFDSDDESSNNSLWKSCMRSASLSKSLSIYVDNPDVCKLLIRVNDDEQLLGRALIWKTAKGTMYMDRIYAVDHAGDKGKFYEWGQENGIDCYYDFSPSIKAAEIVKVKSREYYEYPYSDTFKYYDEYEGEMYQLMPDYDMIHLDTAGGRSYISDEYTWSEGAGRWLDRDDATYCDDIDGFAPADEATYLEYLDITVTDDVSTVRNDRDDVWYREEDAVYSEELETWILKEDAVKVYVSSDTEDWVLKGDSNTFEHDGKLYMEGRFIKDPFTGDFVFVDEKVDGKKIGKIIEEKLDKEFYKYNPPSGFDKKRFLDDAAEVLAEMVPSDELKAAVLEAANSLDYVSDYIEGKDEKQMMDDVLIPMACASHILSDSMDSTLISHRPAQQAWVFEQAIDRMAKAIGPERGDRLQQARKAMVGDNDGWQRSKYIAKTLAVPMHLFEGDAYKYILYLNI